MKRIVIDTETTGLDPNLGHRIIEIGCVEIQDRKITERIFHCYLNPERLVDHGAIQVHGLTDDFLKNQPLFKDKCVEFLDFIKDAELIMHNAPFDMSFLDAECRIAKINFQDILKDCQVTDTLYLARLKHPGQKNSLDALSQRYQVNQFERKKHGALLDAKILAHVYLALTGGQSKLFEDNENKTKKNKHSTVINMKSQITKMPVVEPSVSELEMHNAFIQHINKSSGYLAIWEKLEDKK